MKNDRQTAGIWCHEVLSDLSEFIDGVLGSARRQQIENHLADCDACAQFGQEFSDVVHGLNNGLSNGDDGVAPPSANFRSRLREIVDGEKDANES